MTATFSFQYSKSYKVTSKWNTIIDDVYSGGEQRRNMWTNSRKKWVLEFNKNEVDSQALMDFFDDRKGRYESFNWVWQATHPITGEKMGGDGQTYTVRFDDDELNFDHLRLGYNKFQITLVEVVS
jgi:hypothetical protein